MRRYPDTEDCDIDAGDEDGHTPFDPDCEPSIFYDDCDSIDDYLHKKLNLSQSSVF